MATAIVKRCACATVRSHVVCTVDPCDQARFHKLHVGGRGKPLLRAAAHARGAGGATWTEPSIHRTREIVWNQIVATYGLFEHMMQIAGCAGESRGLEGLCDDVSNAGIQVRD